jgi:2-oxoisovalerate dehydrogenase E2 component (dihydrolipoyl transacylase)
VGQVPNIKRVQERSLVDIAHELARLQAAAQAGRLPQGDLAGGTLTVSNIGAIGGTYAMPLVNVPEAAIVALGRCAHMRAHARSLRMHARPSLCSALMAQHLRACRTHNMPLEGSKVPGSPYLLWEQVRKKR